MSSESGWDIAKFYVDDILKGLTSGDKSGCNNLNLSNEIVKVTYTKDNSTSVGYDNVVITMNTCNPFKIVMKEKNLITG